MKLFLWPQWWTNTHTYPPRQKQFQEITVDEKMYVPQMKNAKVLNLVVKLLLLTAFSFL